MKKNILTLALLGAIVAGGVSISSKTYAATTQKIQQKIISVEEANKIALKQTNNGQIIKSELDTERGVLVYEIEVLENNVKKEFNIDAGTGKILRVEEKFKNHRNGHKGHGQHMYDEVKISMDEARKIATSEAKNAVIKSIELEHRRGLPVYEVEILDGNVKKEFEIDATNGNIIKFDERYKQKYGNMHNINEGVKISMEEAKNIALKQVNNGQIKSIELDIKRGIPTYEVEVMEGFVEKEIRIDAVNGNVLKIKID